MSVTRDSLILQITQGGDSLSWEEFFSIYQPFLFRVVKRWGIKDEDASDIVQDVFVTLVRTLPQFEYRPEKGRFRGWLKTIVRNAAIDWFRRKGRNREVSLDALQNQNGILTEDAEWDSAYCLKVLQFAMLKTKSTSNAVTWYCFEEKCLRGRKASEVGADCGLTANSVRVNASRTWSRIRSLCAALDGDLAAAILPERVDPELGSKNPS